jgi:hypothetical protein
MDPLDNFLKKPLSNAEVCAMTPAQVLEVERICLGAAILHPVYLEYVLAGLTPNHFTVRGYRQLFACLKQRRAAGQWCHPELLCEALPDWTPPEPIASLTYLRRLREEAQPKLNHISRSAQLLTRRLALGKTELSNKLQATSENGSSKSQVTGNKSETPETGGGSPSPRLRSGQALVAGQTEPSFQCPVSGFQKEATASSAPSAQARETKNGKPETNNREQVTGEEPRETRHRRGEQETDSNERETGNGKLLALSEVAARPVDWVWEPYLSAGTVALLSGDPGVGKTHLALAIAAQISNRPQATSYKLETPKAGRERETGNVLYVGGIDSPAQVLRPRFDALGGNPTRFHLLLSNKLQASGNKPGKPEQSSSKLQATSHKPEKPEQNSNRQQAASAKAETTKGPTEKRELATENSAKDRKPETGNGKFFSLLGRTFLPQRVLKTQRKTVSDPTENRELRTVQPSDQCPVASFQNGSEAVPENWKRETGNRKLFSLLDEALRQTRARLVIIDPLESLLAALGIGPRSQKLRRLMDQFVQLAEEHQCCVLLVRNVSRSATGKANAHALGSLELTGAVRSHLLAGVSPDNPDQRALVQMKSNLSALGPGLGYSIDSAGVFHWTGASQLTSEEILSPPRNAEQKSALEEAEDFLRGALADGPENVWQIQRDAKEMMIAPITLQRAKRRLGLASRKSAGSWQWVMPERSNKQQNSNKLQAPSHKSENPGEDGNKLPATSGKEECGSKLAETLSASQRETGDRERETKLRTENFLETGFNDHLHIGQTA